MTDLPAIDTDALLDLRRALDVPLVLDLPDAAGARAAAGEIVDQIDGYLLPRLERLDAPLLVVLGGSTGSGKSTLTNALAGSRVTTPGVLRPTTRLPVLACRPEDVTHFDGGGILPELPRSTGGDAPSQEPGAPGLHLVVTDTVPAGIALLDSPDIDSVELANHDLATQLLGAADLWLFVTTAVRYADAVPWDYLRRAAQRAVALAVVINRVPPGAESELRDDLARMLRDEGLADARLFTVTEGALGDDWLAGTGNHGGAAGHDGSAAGIHGGVAGHAGGAAGIHEWLTTLAADAEARRDVVLGTVSGLVASLPARAGTVLAAAEADADAAERLATHARQTWGRAAEDVDRHLADGVALRQEVLDRFAEHVGTSELMGRVQAGVGRLRDRVAAAVGRRPTPAGEVRDEIGHTLEALIRRIADRAALATIDGWDTLPGGRTITVAAPRGIDRASAGLDADAARLAADWQQAVLDLVTERAGSRVPVARTLSYGVNGIGAALMLGVFSQTGGITGGEAAIAGGTAAASQAVLTAVFGDHLVRDLVRRARSDLLARVGELFGREADRQIALLAGAASADDVATLRSAVDGLR